MLDSLVQAWDAVPPMLRFGGVIGLLLVVFLVGVLLKRGGRSRSEARMWPMAVCDQRIDRIQARLDRHTETHSKKGVLATVTGANTAEARRTADVQARKLERELALWKRRRSVAENAGVYTQADTKQDREGI